MAGRAQAIGGDGVAKLAQLGLGPRATRRRFDYLRAEALAAEAGVLFGLLAAELMVDVESVYAVAEGPKCMPEAGRVRPTRDQAQDVAPRGDEIVPADVLLDPSTKSSAIHGEIVGARLARPGPGYNKGATSQPLVRSASCASSRTVRAKLASP